MNVLFDLDGTLTDPRQGIVGCIKHALGALGCRLPADRELERFIGPPLHETFAALLGPGGEHRVKQALTHYRERFASTGMFENAVYPGIPEALAQLRDAGATLYVATSKPSRFAEPIIEHFALGGFFRSVHGSELDGTRSNKGELIAHLLKTESLPPATTTMVGDRLHDVIGARANGVLSVGVLWGYGTREELTAAGANALCAEPSKLAQSVLMTRGS